MAKDYDDTWVNDNDDTIKNVTTDAVNQLEQDLIEACRNYEEKFELLDEAINELRETKYEGDSSDNLKNTYDTAVKPKLEEISSVTKQTSVLAGIQAEATEKLMSDLERITGRS